MAPPMGVIIMNDEARLVSIAEKPFRQMAKMVGNMMASKA